MTQLSDPNNAVAQAAAAAALQSILGEQQAFVSDYNSDSDIGQDEFDLDSDRSNSPQARGPASSRADD